MPLPISQVRSSFLALLIGWASRFFQASSILIAVLAVILVGNGVAALLNAGWVTQALIQAPRIEWLGAYPSWHSLLAHLVVLAAAATGFIANAHSATAQKPERKEYQ